MFFLFFFCFFLFIGDVGPAEKVKGVAVLGREAGGGRMSEKTNKLTNKQKKKKK